MTALDYFLNGRELVLRRRFADAVRPLNSALQADPDKTSAHLLLAVCYLNMQPKALSQARTSLTTCIRSHRDLVALYLMRALVAGEEGNQALEKIAQSHPDRGGGRPSPARREGGDRRSAEADYRQALKLKPSDDLRYVLLDQPRPDVAPVEPARRRGRRPRSGHPAQAEPVPGSRHAGPGLPAPGPAGRRRRVVRHGRSPAIRNRSWRPGSIAAAPCSMPTASDITPDQRKAALRDLEEAIRHEPDKALKVRDHVDRAKLFFAGGQSQEALAACDAALALLPDDAAAHRVRISALMELKRYDEVLASADAYHRARQALGRDLRDPRPGPRGAAAITPRRSPTSTGPSSSRRNPQPAPRSRLLNLRGWPTISPTHPSWPCPTSRSRCGWMPTRATPWAAEGWLASGRAIGGPR